MIPESGTDEAPKKILIVDDHPVFRKGLAAVIQEQADLRVCGEAENAQTALDAMRKLQPDIALLDISLPGTNGIELTKMFLAENPKIIILILSMHDESVYAMRALRAGASGYVMKAEALTHVVTALRKVINKGIYVSARLSESLIYKAVLDKDGTHTNPIDRLSDREMEVFQWMGRGYGTKEIANALNLSAKTIETHRVHIKEKLGFFDARELSRFAIEWNAQQN
jgi:DNA-binding NarL/FixJ family response regulator